MQTLRFLLGVGFLQVLATRALMRLLRMKAEGSVVGWRILRTFAWRDRGSLLILLLLMTLRRIIRRWRRILAVLFSGGSHGRGAWEDDCFI